MLLFSATLVRPLHHVPYHVAPFRRIGMRIHAHTRALRHPCLRFSERDCNDLTEALNSNGCIAKYCAVWYISVRTMVR